MTIPRESADAASSPNPPVSAGRALLNGAIFLLVFALSCGLLGRLLPFPAVPGVREKVRHLARHGDDYDVLFIGSSRVHFQVMPSVFDSVMGESSGIPVKSFNAGIAGMWSPEDGYVLEEILRGPHRRLRWVFIEIARLGTSIDRAATERSTHWHDGPRLSLLARRLYGQWSEARARLAQAPGAGFAAQWKAFSDPAAKLVEHTRQWAARAVNLGRAASMLTDWESFAGTGRKARKALGEKGDGWTSAGRDRQQMSAEIQQKYERTYADRLANPAVREPGDPVSQAALDHCIAAIRRIGATPVLIVPPTTLESHFYPTPGRAARLVILDFSDIRRYPELFVPEHRLDIDHVNTAGSEAFTRALAHEFKKMTGPSSTPR